MGPKIQKSWKIKILIFKIMKSIFYQTKMKQKKSIKIFKISFKYNSTIKLPKNAIIIMAMIFHDFWIFGPTTNGLYWPINGLIGRLMALLANEWLN